VLFNAAAAAAGQQFLLGGPMEMHISLKLLAVMLNRG
jgi:hypothetical protein